MYTVSNALRKKNSVNKYLKARKRRKEGEVGARISVF